ncbi:hypothetical protein BCR42DRAFT_395105 [Absidia repens]|uniref:Uncharacterized protein n=1 Tax=Absidia repens TaxID=90262 RepID=A0A1X2I841_9FUNG|nr:hypothetical protein BCR42DRAFT_395105 [Absidia repens]
MYWAWLAGCFDSLKSEMAFFKEINMSCNASMSFRSNDTESFVPSTVGSSSSPLMAEFLTEADDTGANFSCSIRLLYFVVGESMVYLVRRWESSPETKDFIYVNAESGIVMSNEPAGRDSMCRNATMRSS